MSIIFNGIVCFATIDRERSRITSQRAPVLFSPSSSPQGSCHTHRDFGTRYTVMTTTYHSYQIHILGCWPIHSASCVKKMWSFGWSLRCPKRSSLPGRSPFHVLRYIGVGAQGSHGTHTNLATFTSVTLVIYHKHQFIAIQCQGMSIHIIQYVNGVHDIQNVILNQVSTWCIHPSLYISIHWKQTSMTTRHASSYSNDKNRKQNWIKSFFASFEPRNLTSPNSQPFAKSATLHSPEWPPQDPSALPWRSFALRLARWPRKARSAERAMQPLQLTPVLRIFFESKKVTKWYLSTKGAIFIETTST